MKAEKKEGIKDQIDQRNIFRNKKKKEGGVNCLISKLMNMKLESFI